MTAAATNDAQARLAAALADLRNADGGWPYYRGRRSRLEPTCWAMLATGIAFHETPLASWANRDGLFVEPGVPHANFAFNGLAALAIAETAPANVRATLVRALVVARGETLPSNSAIRLDSQLQGWSWMAGTFSWVEPTAWCMLALKRQGASTNASARIGVGERILRDRVCRDGGWNYGNSEVFEHQLPGHVPPTAAAIMAMQDHSGDSMVQRAAAFLELRAPAEGSTAALALGALALDTVDRDAANLRTLLAARHAAAMAFGNAATLAMAAVALAGPSRTRPFRLLEGLAP